MPSAASTIFSRVDGVDLVELADERLHLVPVEGLERHEHRLWPGTRPRRPRVEEVAPRGAEDEQRNVGREADDVLDQVEERRFRPVHVVEDRDQRPVVGERLEELARGPRRLLRRSSRRAETDRTGETVGDDDSLVGAHGLGNTVVGSRAAHLTHDLPEWPVRDPLAVRQAAPDDDPSSASDASEELAGEPRLADPGSADQRAELRQSLRNRAVECAIEVGQLARAPDERRVDTAREGRCVRQHLEKAERRNRLGLALRDEGVTGSVLTASRTSRSVCSPIRTSPAEAACSRRAATFTASPVTSVSPAPDTTSPVLSPIRTSSPRRPTTSRISAAARTARSASSSCTCGSPNTAIAASPTNFSTVPPWRSRIVRRSAWYPSMISRSTSGSLCSPSAVEPTRSQKTTVTVFLTPLAVPAARSAPHLPQKRKPSGFSLPHERQTVTSRV